MTGRRLSVLETGYLQAEDADGHVSLALAALAPRPIRPPC